MRTTITIALLLLSVLSYAQKSTLIQNINVRAKELKHNLNKSGDSIILESKSHIDKVSIFNSGFEKKFIVEQNTAKIPLNNIPVGRFVTEVKLNNKLIIITLLRHEVLTTIKKSITAKTTKSMSSESLLASQNEANGKMRVKKAEIIKKPNKKVRFYWIVNKIYKGHSSRKIMKIGDREAVSKMIAQNKIDHKTKSGKYNELTIWEVYDTTKFMRFKRQNPNYANAKDADSFNVTPFFQALVTISND